MKRCAEDKSVIQFSQSNLIDKFNRHLNYLRLSIIDRCNLGCVYCAPDAGLPKLPHAEILTYEEILRLVNIGIRLGITKVRITGGEPLVRKGVYAFLDQLTRLRGLQDVSLTTNGILLKDHIQKIKSAGIKRLNISLDSLNRKKFQKITGFDSFPQVWEGIKLAREAGFEPIKLNIVVLKGINDDELIVFYTSLSYQIHRIYAHRPSSIGPGTESARTADQKTDSNAWNPYSGPKRNAGRSGGTI